MNDCNPEPLVSTAWLEQHLDDHELRILDASWHLPGSQRDARVEFNAVRIPGAVFFDIDEIADRGSGLPHMAPSSEQFATQMESLGVGDHHRVVVYDSHGLFSAARAWWLFKLMGKCISVLDGGLIAWLDEGRPMEESSKPSSAATMTAHTDSRLVRDFADVACITADKTEQIIDARPAGRFRGEEPEPRPGLRSGNIPGAINVPYETLLQEGGRLKLPEDIRSVLINAGVDLDRPVVSSCGSGVTAAIVNLALEVIGHRKHAVYDGSWADWGSRPASEAPIA